MLAASNSTPLIAIPGYRVGKSIFIGGIRKPWLLNKRMPLLPDVKYGHIKLWKPPFDRQRRLLGRFVRLVSRLQLPVDRHVKWFGQGWFTDSSRRGC